jgi:diguanylate cyclase (GGDEF)-like protein
LSDKARWLIIYTIICTIPFLIPFLHLSEPLVSHAAITNFLKYAPYLGFALMGILGWQINQTRIFWTALFLLSFYPYLLRPTNYVESDYLRYLSFEVLGAAFPLSLCFIFAFKESRLWSDKSLLRSLLALSPFILFFSLSQWAHGLYQQIFYWGFHSPDVGIKVPPIVWASIIAFLATIRVLPDQKIKPFLMSLLPTLIPFYLVLQARLSAIVSPLPPTRAQIEFKVIVSFTAMTAVLLHAILHMYWKKVYMDILTNVPNRQALDERLHTLTKTFSLAMVDIDHFKKFNDTYGHAEGDNVLRMVAQNLEESLGDKVYRYGGEEFCVIFEGEGLEKAVESMEKTRAALAKRKFTLRSHKRRKGDLGNFFTNKPDSGGKKVQINVSVGVATSNKGSEGYESVIKRADQALYEAKEKGRNRVVASNK